MRGKLKGSVYSYDAYMSIGLRHVMLLRLICPYDQISDKCIRMILWITRMFI